MEEHKTTRIGYTEWLHKARQKLAASLGERTSQMSGRRLRYWCMAIVVTLGLFCSLLLYKGLSGTAAALRRQQGFTATVLPVEKETREGRHSLSGGYKATRQLRNYIDSLRNNVATREQYKELLRTHPQLLDSLEVLESYYQSKIIP